MLGDRLGCTSRTVMSLDARKRARMSFWLEATTSRATGSRPPLPPRLADLYERDEHYIEAPNDLFAIQALVRASVLRNAA